jgi:hypothetical protein
MAAPITADVRLVATACPTGTSPHPRIGPIAS